MCPCRYNNVYIVRSSIFFCTFYFYKITNYIKNIYCYMCTIPLLLHSSFQICLSLSPAPFFHKFLIYSKNALTLI